MHFDFEVYHCKPNTNLFYFKFSAYWGVYCWSTGPLSKRKIWIADAEKADMGPFF